MVGRAARDGARARQLRHLHDVSDFPERVFSVRPRHGNATGIRLLSFADVLTALGAARLCTTVGVARDVDPVDARRLPVDMLLLSQGVLPGVLFGPPSVCGG